MRPGTGWWVGLALLGGGLADVRSEGLDMGASTGLVSGVEALPELPALDLDPEWIALDTARQHLLAGQRLEALAVLREVLRRDVHHAVALTLVATTLAELGRQREAVRLLQQLARDHAGDYVVLNNLAWLLATAADPALRDPAQAVDLARQSLLLAPDNYSVWSTVAEAYYRSGRYDMALRAAEQALELARAQQAEGSRLATYAEQVQKSRQAVEAFTLLDP